MERDASMLSTLNELAHLPLDDAEVENTAEAVVALAMRTVDCEFAGLTIARGKRRFESIAPTDPVVGQADRLQYELGEGPCLDAAQEWDTFVCNDLANDSRWPTWGPKAAALGLSSLLATRLANSDRTLGALNLYSSEPREYSADDRQFAQVFAMHAAPTLLAVLELQHLRSAVDARTLIGQAQGILMERFDIDAATAFSVLRRHSMHHNVKLRLVAEELIANRSRTRD